MILLAAQHMQYMQHIVLLYLASSAHYPVSPEPICHHTHTQMMISIQINIQILNSSIQKAHNYGGPAAAVR